MSQLSLFYQGRTIMMDAAFTGDAAIVKLLLNHGGGAQLATKSSMVSNILWVLNFAQGSDLLASSQFPFLLTLFQRLLTVAHTM